MSFIVLQKGSMSYVGMLYLLGMVVFACIPGEMSLLRPRARELYCLIYRSDEM